MTAILVVAGLTLLVSFFCSLSEAALYAVSPGQAEALADAGRKGALRLQRLRKDVEEPISAILTVNTVANTAGATWFGSLVAARYGGEAETALAIGTALLTFSILVIAEIVPKSLGVRHAKTVAPLVAWPLQFMIWFTWPIVRAASYLIQWIAGTDSSAPSEEEVIVMSRLAAQAGAVRGQEHRWVENALVLDKVQARHIMTPRTVVRFLPADTRIADLDPKGRIMSHSRVPITEGADLDHIVGIVYRKHLLDELLAGPTDRTVGELVRPVDFIPETLPGHTLLNKLVNDKVHLAVVVDEFGGVEGVVTLEDVLESLLGSEIVDEHDEVTDMQVLARENAQRAAAEREAGTHATGAGSSDPGGPRDG